MNTRKSSENMHFFDVAIHVGPSSYFIQGNLIYVVKFQNIRPCSSCDPVGGTTHIDGDSASGNYTKDVIDSESSTNAIEQ